ncbi:MAG: hypothetical protein IM331_18045 [Microcystis sp. M038S1]|uniref:hypothetical protein n=2 Tax=unclassified Microcystis TaxID=2643300 RepID=UPI002586AC75|nr:MULTISPECIES: hypothetical protein [unclassified Microcystis]MCA2824700.1 hypothetical protein [Microcystis sp. M088S1]MCA2860958.1 hypothetical protein [Microcystis sp. M005S1]MCA2864915.1 hypothetical protein [Microcystis sp. M049S1]MCA2917341.1 hypothetical protein [Microcystis sp. M017S1]MCA2925399.1 hypothetical protein [Microcystis sp. M020S1]MCA2955927.1 hypothetical protein [Microcystis sp. M010S1]
MVEPEILVEVMIVTIRETAISKLQQLPEVLVQEVSDFIDLLDLDILAAVKRTAIPHHATFLGWSLNGVDASPKNA